MADLRIFKCAVCGKIANLSQAQEALETVMVEQVGVGREYISGQNILICRVCYKRLSEDK